MPGRIWSNADEGANRDEGFVRLINGHSYKLPTHPLEKVFNISDNVDPSTHSQHVSILGKQGGIDNPPPCENKVDCLLSIKFWLLVFGLLEVWIWIEKEHLGQLAFLKEIGQIPEKRLYPKEALKEELYFIALERRQATLV